MSLIDYKKKYFQLKYGGMPKTKRTDGLVIPLRKTV